MPSDDLVCCQERRLPTLPVQALAFTYGLQHPSGRHDMFRTGVTGMNQERFLCSTPCAGAYFKSISGLDEA